MTHPDPVRLAKLRDALEESDRALTATRRGLVELGVKLGRAFDLVALRTSERDEARAELAAIDKALGPKPWRTGRGGQPVETSRADAVADWIQAARVEAREVDRLNTEIDRLRALQNESNT